MRALVIDDRMRATLAELSARAAASPTDYATMQAIARATGGAVRGARQTPKVERVREMNRALTVALDFGYTVTLTHEEHKPGVMCRHVSVGIVGGRPATGPNPAAVKEVMAALGFVNKIGALPMWTETLQDGTLAINAVEPLDGRVEALAQ